MNKVTVISLEELRNLEYEGILQKLVTVQNLEKIVANAADGRDIGIFVTVLLTALAAWKIFRFRCATGSIWILGGSEHHPLLTHMELCSEDSKTVGLVIIDSHVKKR